MNIPQINIVFAVNNVIADKKGLFSTKNNTQETVVVLSKKKKVIEG